MFVHVVYMCVHVFLQLCACVETRGHFNFTVYLLCMHMHVSVRRQLEEVGSSHHVGPRDLTQAVGLGSKNPPLLSPLTSLSALLINPNLTILARLADQCEPLIYLCLPLALPSPSTGAMGTCHCMGFYMTVGIQPHAPMLTQQTLYPLSAPQYPCIKKKSCLEEVLHNQFKHQASRWSVW